MEFNPDLINLESFIFDELCKEEKLPIQIVQEALQYYPDKRVIQEAIAFFQEMDRRFKWCEAKNHGDGKYIVDDSYGGPESGYMGYHCKKCGFSEGSQLY